MSTQPTPEQALTIARRALGEIMALSMPKFKNGILVTSMENIPLIWQKANTAHAQTLLFPDVEPPPKTQQPTKRPLADRVHDWWKDQDK